MDSDNENIELVSTNFYDIVETYPDCTVQVLKNSVTGEVSIGWWRNDEYPEWSEESEDDSL